MQILWFRDLQKKRCHSEAAPAGRVATKDLMTTELFLGRRGASEVVCTAPTKQNIYEYEKSLCTIKITQ